MSKVKMKTKLNKNRLKYKDYGWQFLRSYLLMKGMVSKLLPHMMH